MDVLPGLDTFLLVARHGSISAAADELGVPRSTVLRRVSALEAHLGHALLVRGSRGIRPTEAGALLVERGRPLVAALRDVEATVRDLGEEPRGTLRVAVPPGLGASFLGEFLGEIRRRWPALRVEITVREVPPDLLDEALDIVLREGPLPDSPWYARPIGPADRLVVASPAYLAARGLPGLGDLGRHDILALATPSDPPDAWPLLAGGTIAVTPVLVSTDYQTLHSVTCEGLGLALLPLHVTVFDLAAERLVHVLPEVGRRTALYAVTAHGRHELPKVRAVFDLVDEFVARYGTPSDLARRGGQRADDQAGGRLM